MSRGPYAPGSKRSQRAGDRARDLQHVDRPLSALAKAGHSTIAALVIRALQEYLARRNAAALGTPDAATSQSGCADRGVLIRCWTYRRNSYINPPQKPASKTSLKR
jgi:hypothetical protein